MLPKSIVVTRPLGQEQQLIGDLHTAFSGIVPLNTKLELPRVLSLPLLSILPKAELQLPKTITATLRNSDFAIFVSPNAIECVMRLIGLAKTKNANLTSGWQEIPNRIIPIGVMGRRSVKLLESFGIGMELDSKFGSSTPIFMPTNLNQWDSEGLWDEMQKLSWDWTKQRIVIFKGDGGREWLANKLTNVGAHVDAISVYSRVPLPETSPCWKAINDIDFSNSLWIFTSSEAVRHLGNVCKSALVQGFNQSTALCPHINIANAAQGIGFGKILSCDPGNEGLIKASRNWFLGVN